MIHTHPAHKKRTNSEVRSIYGTAKEEMQQWHAIEQKKSTRCYKDEESQAPG